MKAKALRKQRLQCKWKWLDLWGFRKSENIPSGLDELSDTLAGIKKKRKAKK